jgi:glycogen debranching enzyme
LPWLDATFGRDAIVVAFQMLWLWPDIARNVLRYLAATQSGDSFAATGAEPGKILQRGARRRHSAQLFRRGHDPAIRHAGRGVLRALPISISSASCGPQSPRH